MISTSERQAGGAFEHARERLEQLYEISKLLTGFESVDATVTTALAIMARTLALQSVILIVDAEHFFERAVWHAPGMSEQALLAAETRAHAVGAQLVDPAFTPSAAVDERRTYSGVLTGSVVNDGAGARVHPSVLLLPLVIARHPLFGVLQLEVSAPIDEPDLAFASAITHQLAMALDRYRALRQETALRDRAEALAQSERELRVSAQVARSEAERLVSQLMHQKADLKEIEATLHRTVKQRDEFIAIASHELRNPLSALHVLVATIELASTTEGDKLSREWVAPRLARCQAQIVRLTRLLENLLDVSRLTVGRIKLEPEEGLNLSALVREEVERIQPANASASITLRAGPDVCGSWDRLRLDQVVTNLLSNAVKYGQGNPIDVSIESSGGTAELVVTDHGIGIAPEDQARVFERFERAVPGSKFIGFGLGLWITKQLVEAMRGTIGLESTLGVETSFTVRLPLA